eukprot:TRINITY_DN10170_c0_g6_i2.p1 TRINITY_DN10170_c0_g6~~TRINITY_DN10170_c0_g6_i2.p1  ORF type:complete len:801 (-),score=176.52 TRINITY_DN10170_c0_g6_i2:117-2255(-)
MKQPNPAFLTDLTLSKTTTSGPSSVGKFDIFEQYLEKIEKTTIEVSQRSSPPPSRTPQLAPGTTSTSESIITSSGTPNPTPAPGTTGTPTPAPGTPTPAPGTPTPAPGTSGTPETTPTSIPGTTSRTAATQETTPTSIPGTTPGTSTILGSTSTTPFSTNLSSIALDPFDIYLMEKDETYFPTARIIPTPEERKEIHTKPPVDGEETVFDGIESEGSGDPECDSDYENFPFPEQDTHSCSKSESSSSSIDFDDNSCVTQNTVEKLEKVESKLWVVDKKMRISHKYDRLESFMDDLKAADELLDSYWLILNQAQEPKKEEEVIVHQPAIIPQTITLGKWNQYIHHNTPWFHSYFANRPYIVTLGVDKEGMSFMGIIKSEERILGLPPVIRGIISNHLSSVYCILDERDIELAVIKNWAKCWHFIIEQMVPELRSNLKLDIIQSPYLEEAYLAFEKATSSRLCRHTLPVGIILVKKNQLSEEEYFLNNSGSSSFDNFLEFIGKTVLLKNWSKYDGELDTKSNHNGTHSLYTMSHGVEIMFHVSTMLNPGLEGYVTKKRFIGNDSVLIVFQDLGCNTSFDVSSVPSRMNRVFIIVRALQIHRGQRRYHIGVARKADVPQFGPALSYPPVYTLDSSFRKMFLRLVINAQLAVDRSPIIIEKTGQTKAQAKAFSELLMKLKKKKKVQKSAPTDITSTSSVGLTNAVGTIGSVVLSAK